jgi:hypothetical protein
LSIVTQQLKKGPVMDIKVTGRPQTGENKPGEEAELTRFQLGLVTNTNFC